MSNLALYVKFATICQIWHFMSNLPLYVKFGMEEAPFYFIHLLKVVEIVRGKF